MASILFRPQCVKIHSMHYPVSLAINSLLYGAGSPLPYLCQARFVHRYLHTHPETIWHEGLVNKALESFQGKWPEDVPSAVQRKNMRETIALSNAFSALFDIFNAFASIMVQVVTKCYTETAGKSAYFQIVHRYVYLVLSL